MPSRSQKRRERLALNEADFRDINDRVLRDLTGLHRPPERLVLVCECSRTECRSQLTLTPAVYEAVRADARSFLLTPGHEVPDVEDVVDRGDGYIVIRKHEDVTETVVATDPRS